MGLLDKLKNQAVPDRKSDSNPQLMPDSMPLIHNFDRGRLLVRDVSGFLRRINGLIRNYNATSDEQAKRDRLKQMQQTMRHIDYKYPSSYLAASHAYQAAHSNLFQQFDVLGINTVRDETQSPSSLPEIIANMSPEKALALLIVLFELKTEHLDLDKALENLYNSESRTTEAKNFRVFLQNHTISYLGRI